jgi:hypothetical protein
MISRKAAKPAKTDLLENPWAETTADCKGYFFSIVTNIPL